MMSRLLLPLVALSLIVIEPSAWAQPTGQSVLNAVSFQPIPPSQPIAVQVLDDSDENLAVKKQLEAALGSRGFHVAGEQAPLLLTIDTGENVGAWTTSGDTSQIPMMDDRGRLFPQGQLEVTKLARLPLPETTVVTPAQYRLGLTLDQSSGGVRLWQGWTIADLTQGEPAELARAMVPKLAESIGRTVREESFDLR